MNPRKYARPDFLPKVLDQAHYEKWLRGRALAHFRRDRKRGNLRATNEDYRVAIHEAVIRSGGRNFYTDERLDWSLLGRYNNAESRAKRREYKATFALLPTIDHVGDGLGEADFRLCGWATNDAKSDLSYDEFVKLGRIVVSHFDETKH